MAFACTIPAVATVQQDDPEVKITRWDFPPGAVTGQHQVGFRGPGYILSADVLRVLVDRGYRYDCSTLPTVIGPLARKYYFRSAQLTAEQRAERSYLFGGFREGLRRLRAVRRRIKRERPRAVWLRPGRPAAPFETR